MTEEIVIERVFHAPVEKVWEAWTSPELIKQWWGPEGFSVPVVKVDFRVGGKYLYAMHGPKDTQFDKDMSSAGEYKEIVPMEKLVVTDYFSDEMGNKMSATEQGLPEGMPDEMTVVVTFKDVADGKTKLSIIYTPENQEMYDAMLKSGMKEGWSTSLDKFAKVVEK